jgi:hypothetical protein
MPGVSLESKFTFDGAGYNSLLVRSIMDKSLAIVLSRPVANYRKLAQEWYGLTDEQMVGRHVHHNPPRHQGGRDIPEHLYVYTPEVHDYVHGGNGFTLACSEGGKRGGKIGGKSKNKNKDACRRGGLKGGKTTGAKAQQNRIGFFGLPVEVRRENSRKGGQQAVKSGQIKTLSTPESCAKGGKIAGKMNSHHIAKVLWRCTVSGAVSTAAGLTHIQRAHGIDKKYRERVYPDDNRV